MIVLDLQIAIFVLLLGLLGGLSGGYWLLRRRGRPATNVQVTGWQTLQGLPFGIVVQDQDRTVVFMNDWAQRLLDTATTSEAGELLQRFGDAGRVDTPQRGVVSQSAPLRWWRYPIADQGTLLVLTDDSEQQHALRRQQAFIGQLAHELRTPLTALIAHTEIARNPRTSNPVRQTSLETIQRETQRMAHLVRDLLELYRLETAADLPLQPTNPVLVAETAIAQVILRAEEQGMDLLFDADQTLPLVLAHPDRLAQVFANLLDNAIKYGRAGDTITVRINMHPEGVSCVVQDSGPGIPAEELPRVTEQLYRVRTDVEGSGMGLALVSEILRRHHAALLIESNTAGEASGTTCRWVLRKA
jgi:two-component system phosphate regulon sensor histidine kinase PhoR